MIEIKYDNSEENLSQLQRRIQERNLRYDIRNTVYWMKTLDNITDSDINNIIQIKDNGIQQFLDFDNIGDDNPKDNLHYDELNTLYNMLKAFDKDFKEMKNKEMEGV